MSARSRRRAVAQWRGNLDLLRQVNGQRRHQQTLLQEAADAMDAAGAHLLLQTRAQTLDGTPRRKFEKWYPGPAANDAGISLTAVAA